MLGVCGCCANELGNNVKKLARIVTKAVFVGEPSLCA